MPSQEFSLPGILAAWETGPAGKQAGLSFGLDEAAEDLPVWRTSLPADPAAADAMLDRAERQLEATQAALEAVSRRVEALAAGSAAGAASFGVERLPDAEAELLDLLTPAAAGQTGLSFGLTDISLGGFQQAQEFFASSLQRLSGAITRLALVETSAGGALVGRTVIDWSGDLETAWQPPLLPERQRQHERSLQNALTARTLLMRMLFTSAQSAAKIAAALAVPGGPIMALPAVWKFMTRIMHDMEQLSEL